MSIETVQRRRHLSLQDRVQAYKWLELAIPTLAPGPGLDAEGSLSAHGADGLGALDTRQIIP